MSTKERESPARDELEINYARVRFKKFGGDSVGDVGEYVLDYVHRVNPNAKVIVGCDSAQRRSKTHFALAVVLYDEDAHAGAHCIFLRHKTTKIREVPMRLYQEAAFVLSLAEYIHEKLDGWYTRSFPPNADGSRPTKLVETHLDVNPSPGEAGRNKSNLVYAGTMGMLAGYGFAVKGKNESYAASCAADLICRY